MRVLSSPEALAASVPRVVFCAGSFDGVHRGHRALLDAARALARDRGAEVWALTFEPHPLAVLAPDAAPPLLSPGDLRLEALADAGADGCLLLPFSRGTAALSPADFCARAFGPWSGAAPGRLPSAVSSRRSVSLRFTLLSSARRSSLVQTKERPMFPSRASGRMPSS